MTRDEQEMTLWRDTYSLASQRDWDDIRPADFADHAVAEFRKQFPPPPMPTTATPEKARLGYVAIRAMEVIISIMGLETDHADKLDEIDHSIQKYIAQRWRIETESTP
jgi:hypothetical protein